MDSSSLLWCILGLNLRQVIQGTIIDTPFGRVLFCHFHLKCVIKAANLNHKLPDGLGWTKIVLTISVVKF